jgi:flagellar basal body L-ring protein FlgH
MNKNILFVGLLAILMGACTTSQNSVANNNAQTTPTQSQAPAPVKPTNKYQKNKSNEQLMKAPNVLNERVERAENANAVRDTM